MNLADIYRRTVKSRDIFFNRFVARPLAVPVVALLARTRVTPNQVTLASLAVFVLAAAGLVALPGHGGLLAAVAVLTFSYVLDCADGMLARLTGRSSPFGSFLDFTFDEMKAYLLVAACGTRLALYDPRGTLWLYVALWGLAGVAAGIGLTTFTRRPEYSGQAVRYDGEHDAAPPPKGLVQRLVRLAESLARWLVHYPSYIIYIAIADRLDGFLAVYSAVMWLYFGRTLRSVAKKAGGFNR